MPLLAKAPKTLLKIRAMRFAISALLLTVSLPVYGHFVAPPTRDDRANAYRACLRQAVTQTDMGQCGSNWVNSADAALNALWQRLKGALDAAAFAPLQTSQRAWIVYKDQGCSVYYAGFGSSGKTLSAPRCRAQIIEQRIDILNDLICEQEGDIGCILIRD